MTRFTLLATIVVALGVLAPPALAAGGTTSTIESSANPSSAGQSVTFKVTVTGTLQSPLGFVQLFNGDALLGTPILLSPDFDDFLGCTCVPTNHSSATISRSFSTGTYPITVVYSGDGALGDLPGGGGPLLQVVNAARSGTSVVSSANPSVHGQNVTFTAAISSSGDAPAGSVQFQVDGANAGTPQPVDASGHASLSLSTLATGSHNVVANFASTDVNVLGSSGILMDGILPVRQVVDAAKTSTVVSSSVNPSEFGQAVTFAATETAVAPGAGLPTGTVQFEDNGAAIGSPQAVGSDGRTALTTTEIAVGLHTISATYSSDSDNFTGSSGNLDQTVNRARTTLVYDGMTSSDFDDPALLSALLVRTDTGAPIANGPVAFTIASEACSQTTAANGEASCSITPREAAGAFTVNAGFAGNTDYLASSDAQPFAVTKEETTTTYTGPTVIAQGSPVILNGRLLEDGAAPIDGRTLTLTIGNGSNAESCSTSPTDASGDAQCTIATVTVPQGPQGLTASFASDGYYLPSADASKTAIVFAFPARGVFVLGDRTATQDPASVTFWGARWSSLNTLTGGSPPSSFKGFAASTSSRPPICGGTWTTDPGNSSSPVDALPAYMGTAVSTSIGKSPSTTAGDITSIVVVIAAPGYAPDPGHPGAGTIVAKYC